MTVTEAQDLRIEGLFDRTRLTGRLIHSLSLSFRKGTGGVSRRGMAWRRWPVRASLVVARSYPSAALPPFPEGKGEMSSPTFTVNQSEQIAASICPQAVNTLDVPQMFADLQSRTGHIAAIVVKMAVSVIAAHFIPC